MIITWRTHKTEDGFRFEVVSMGYQIATVILKAGVCQSRAQATLRAKKWARYFKQAANAENALLLMAEQRKRDGSDSER
jgi:hypothetical protein